MSILHIIEPWICHYELFYSVIYHNRFRCSKFCIYSSLPTNTQHDLLGFCKEHNVQLEIYPNLESFKPSPDSILWINTTHIHSNQESFVNMTNFLERISCSPLVSRVYIVLHNQFDISFYFSFLQNQSDSSLLTLPVVLSSDMVGIFLSIINPQDRLYPKVFHPFLPSFYSSRQIPSRDTSTPIKCLITGMAREGKGFNLLYRFKDLVSSNIVSFSYVGWAAPGFGLSSGLNKSICLGLIDSFTVDPIRVPESEISSAIEKSHVLIDLKIPTKPFKFTNTSGLLALSRTFKKPILCHTYQYPTQPAIRFNSIDHLHELLSNQMLFSSGIKLFENISIFNVRQSLHANECLFQ